MVIYVNDDFKIGHGSQKVVYHAFDMLTKTRWAFSLTKDEPDSIIEELEFQEFLAEPENGLEHIQSKYLMKPIGVCRFQSQNGKENICFFTPLMGGTLDHIVEKYRLTNKQRCEIVADLIENLYLLQKKQIEHSDIKPQNVLCEIRGKRVRVFISDYGVSSCNHDKMKKKYAELHFMAGNAFYMSPEKRRYAEMKAYMENSWFKDFKKLKNVDEMLEVRKKMYFATQSKHDVWSLGATLATLLNDSSLWKPYKDAARNVKYPYHAVIDVINRTKVENYEDLFLSADFYKRTFNNNPAVFQEPPKNTILHLVWQMLHFDPDQRPNAESLYKQLRALQKIS